MTGDDEPDSSEAPTLGPESEEAASRSGWEVASAPRRGIGEIDTKVSATLEPAKPERSEPVVGDILGGKYELTDVLGAGGMGTVFKGRHLTLDCDIAVKVMKPHVATQQEYVRRFHREARVASQLDHPNVVRVLDFGQAGTFYIVMEFIEGTSLEDWLGEMLVPPPLADVESILLEVIDALEVAHAAGVVHRDLKPDNIILTKDSRGNRAVKVVDFGLAHFEDALEAGPRLTKDGQIAGTPTYMSPEQCRSLTVDKSTDLYALGCILTTMLQLRPPFDEGASMDIMSNQMFMPPLPLERPNETERVPALLERLRLELLAKRPHQRPAAAAETRRRLIEALDPELSRERLPDRKGDVPLGSREERVLDGYARPSDAPGARSPRSTGTVLLVEDGAEHPADLATGLAAGGVHVVAHTDGPAPALVLLAAGTDLDQTVERLRALEAKHPGCPVIVCTSELDSERMNKLIESGAADVAKLPSPPDRLLKKVRRLLRRVRKSE